jgi:2-(1,2-epoxy-1,2-dihydrophenyl)acetyl-CoA isomerase
MDGIGAAVSGPWIEPNRPSGTARHSDDACACLPGTCFSQLIWPSLQLASNPSIQEYPVTQDLLETFDNGIATLTMNRQEARNAFSREMISALSEALPRLATDSAVRLVVLTGAGKAFCAGGDVKGFARNASGGKAPESFDHKVTDLRARMEVSRWLHEMPKPTLAVIPGAAAGAGLSLALACDLRIAADDAKLTTAFSKVGLSGDFGGSYFLSHLVGAAKARELYFSARVLRADEAQQIGMIDRAVPAAQLADAARDWAAELAALPTIAVGYMKRNLNVAMRGSLSDVLDTEAIHMIRTFETEDHKGAALAFVEKRAPRFLGR